MATVPGSVKDEHMFSAVKYHQTPQRTALQQLKAAAPDLLRSEILVLKVQHEIFPIPNCH
eukprot:scaffold295001_cov19-Tisochrysis_lutea.AAC.1